MDWVNYFFFSFFKDEYAHEAHRRSLLNSFLSLFISLVILCSTLFWGYCASMPGHYAKDDLKAKIYDIVLDSDRVFEVSNKSFSFTTKSGTAAVINEIKNEKLFIVDTRDIKNSFIKFYVSYVNNNGKSLSYKEYLALDENEQKEYRLSVEYTDTLIDFNELQLSEYENWLSKATDTNIKDEYLQLSGKKGMISEQEYTTELYRLFVSSYYPKDVMALDMYSFAPTLRTYYDDIVSNFTDKEFFVLYSDLVYIRFETDRAGYIFSGNPEQLMDKTLSSTDSVDDLLFDAFDQSKSYIFIEYIFNFARLLPVLMIAALLLSLVAWLFFRAIKDVRMSEYLTSFKLINLYTIVSSLVAGIVGFAMSFTTGREQVYKVAILLFGAIVAIRLAVYLVLHLVKLNKEVN